MLGVFAAKQKTLCLVTQVVCSIKSVLACTVYRSPDWDHREESWRLSLSSWDAPAFAVHLHVWILLRCSSALGARSCQTQVRGIQHMVYRRDAQTQKHMVYRRDPIDHSFYRMMQHFLAIAVYMLYEKPKRIQYAKKYPLIKRLAVRQRHICTALSV